MLHFRARKVDPHRICAGWILLGNRNTGSSRIHGLNIHDQLVKRGLDSRILQSPDTPSYKLRLSYWKQLSILLGPLDVVIFQKVIDDAAVRLARLCRFFGKKTILIHCDLVDSPLIKEVDHIVTVSKELKIHLDRRFGVDSSVIEDAIEVPENALKIHTADKAIRLVWVGHSDNWQTLEVLHQVLASPEFSDFELITISNHPEATYHWSIDSVVNHALLGDIGVIPSLDTEWANCKSNNRLTFFAALGLPVIASPVPAYSAIIQQGVNGYIAHNVKDWKRLLDLLRDPETRRVVGYAAKEVAQNDYSVQHIVDQWVMRLFNLVKSGSRIKDNTVS